MSDDEKGGLPILPFASHAAWEAWLARHHNSARGVWIRFAKKGSGIATVAYAEAVESALCYGWIDGQTASLDERFYLQKFTPRGPRSVWSKINRAKVELLIAAGRMQPTGLAAVEKAQADGRWDQAYDSPSTATVPEDLRRALDDHPHAAAFFATLDSRNRYAVLHRIQTAKKPETRARRIQQFAEMLGRGEKVFP